MSVPDIVDGNLFEDVRSGRRFLVCSPLSINFYEECQKVNLEFRLKEYHGDCISRSDEQSDSSRTPDPPQQHPAYSEGFNIQNPPGSLTLMSFFGLIRNIWSSR